jgi:hypothetical protein
VATYSAQGAQLEKLDDGTLVIAADNTGWNAGAGSIGVAVNAGILQLSNSNAIGMAPAHVNNSGAALVHRIINK